MRFWLISAALFHVSLSQEYTFKSCCAYCRAEPKQWVILEGTYKAIDKERTEITAMQSPPAFLVSDEQKVEFDVDSKLRGFIWHYAGAPVELTYEDTSNLDGLLNEQYIQFNLAESKHVGGIQTQGGFYIETTENFVLPSETWMTEFVVSFSNATNSFTFLKNRYNRLQVFEANADAVSVMLHTLDPPIYSKYVRIHPIKGENKDGPQRRINPRVTLVYCDEGICVTPRINCLLSEWSDWTTCECDGSGCFQSHTRTILRVQSCGGEPCDELEETVPCEEPEPAWKNAVIITVVVVGAILILLIVVLVIYKKTHSDRVEVIVVKDAEEEDTAHPAPAAPPPNFKPSVPPMAAGYPMMGGPRFGMPAGPRPPFGGMRPGAGPGGQPHGPAGGGIGGVAPLE